jgi:hypothetical protein
MQTFASLCHSQIDRYGTEHPLPVRTIHTVGMATDRAAASDVGGVDMSEGGEMWGKGVFYRRP